MKRLAVLLLVLAPGCVTTGEMRQFSGIVSTRLESVAATIESLKEHSIDEPTAVLRIREDGDKLRTQVEQLVSDVEERIRLQLEAGQSLVDLAGKNPLSTAVAFGGMLLTSLKGVDMVRDRRRRRRGEPVS